MGYGLKVTPRLARSLTSLATGKLAGTDTIDNRCLSSLKFSDVTERTTKTLS